MKKNEIIETTGIEWVGGDLHVLLKDGRKLVIEGAVVTSVEHDFPKGRSVETETLELTPDQFDHLQKITRG